MSSKDVKSKTISSNVKKSTSSKSKKPAETKKEDLNEDSDFSDDIEDDIIANDVNDEEVDDEEIDDEDEDEDDKIINETETDIDDIDDTDEDDDEYVPEIARQSDKSKLLQNERVVKVVKLTKKEDFITQNILTRFELTSMLCNRAAHLEMGAPPLVDTSDQNDELGIAWKEFKEGKIPFMVSRKVGNKTEWHSGSEMQLNPSIINILRNY